MTTFPHSKNSLALHADDLGLYEPTPEALAAFEEFLNAFAQLTPEQQAIEAHLARQRALEEERRDELKRRASERREDRQRKPRLKTVLDQAKKAGATSVTTPEGYSYTLGHAAVAEHDPSEREIIRLRALRGTR